MLPAHRALRIACILLAGLSGAALDRNLQRDPPKVIYLRERPAPRLDAEQADRAPATDASLVSSMREIPTVEEYCVDGKCDVPDLELVIVIETDSARRLYDDGMAQFVDARESPAFEAGHIADAVHLPAAQLQNGWPGSDELLLPELTTVVYGHPAPDLSAPRVARHLVMLGFRDVKILDGGYPAWREARP